jgi:hypothetical protein
LDFLILLQCVKDFNFVLLIAEADAMLPIEEVDVAKVERVATRVELPGPKGGTVIDVKGEGWIFAQIQRHDEAAATNHILPRTSIARHQRHRDTAGIEVPPAARQINPDPAKEQAGSP